MPRWNPLRWSLGASALVAVFIAGCGAGSTPQKPTLRTSAEKRLLSLVRRARVDATAHNGTAVHAVLGQFVAEVQTLRNSGQLTGTTATNLAQEARTTAAQAAKQLHPAKAARAKPVRTAQTTAAPAATVAATTTASTAPATAATTPADETTQTPSTPSQDDGAHQRNDQGSGDGSGSPRPSGHKHGYGHRSGAEVSAWWTALRNWIDTGSRGGDGND